MKSPVPTGSRRRTGAAVLLAVLVPILVFWRGALLRGVFFQADLVVYYLPAYTYATRVLRTGMLPLWAPELEGGQPFHAQWEPTLLYPVDVPFRLLLPPWWALNLSLVFHYALASVGMFAYARRLSLSRSAALVSAAIYAVNGFMIAHLEHPNLIAGAAWLPLLLLAVEYGLDGRMVGGALGMGAVLGLMLLGGHPDIFLMGALTVGLLALLHPVHGALLQRRLRSALAPLLMLAGGYALGVALAAAQIVPTLDLAHLSWERHGASVGYQDTWSLHPVQFLVQALPDVFGRNGQDTYWGVAHYWEECSYVGTLALALALVGLFSRHRLARFYGGLAALAVWLAMGTNGLAFLLLRQLPAFGTTRLPCRYMLLFDLSIAVLAGIGTHWLSRLHRPVEVERARWVRGLVAAALGAATVWMFGWWLDRHGLIRYVTVQIGFKHRFHTSDILSLVGRYEAQLGLDVALLLGGLALAAGLLLTATRSRGLRRAIPPLAVGGVVATLFVFGSGYHTVIPVRWVSKPPFTVAAIRAEPHAGPFRVLQWDSIKLHSNVAVHRGWWPTDERGYRQYIGALPGNYNLVWGLAGVRQEEWSALPLPYTRKLTSAILAEGERRGFRAMAPYLPWWNAGYVISRGPVHDPDLIPLAADRTCLYRTRNPGRRAWIVHEATVEPDESRLEQRLTTEPSGLMQRVALLSSDGGVGGRGRGGEGGTGRRDGEPEATERRGDGAMGVGERAWVVRQSPTRVMVGMAAERVGYLVLGETWAPGWRAWVDGQAVPILRANLVHRAVRITAGRHRVEFQYVPTAFRLGLFVSVSAVALLLALVTARVGRHP